MVEYLTKKINKGLKSLAGSEYVNQRRPRNFGEIHGNLKHDGFAKATGLRDNRNENRYRVRVFLYTQIIREYDNLMVNDLIAMFTVS